MGVELRVLVSCKSTKKHRKEGRKIERKNGSRKETKNGRKRSVKEEIIKIHAVKQPPSRC
jgi:hypothetical protein